MAHAPALPATSIPSFNLYMLTAGCHLFRQTTNHTHSPGSHLNSTASDLCYGLYSTYVLFQGVRLYINPATWYEAARLYCCFLFIKSNAADYKHSPGLMSISPHLPTKIKYTLHLGLSALDAKTTLGPWSRGTELIQKPKSAMADNICPRKDMFRETSLVFIPLKISTASESWQCQQSSRPRDWLLDSNYYDTMSLEAGMVWQLNSRALGMEESV
jgi:hypothetical protein